MLGSGLIVEGALFDDALSCALGTTSFLPSSNAGGGKASVASKADLARDFFKASRERAGLAGMLDSLKVLPL